MAKETIVYLRHILDSIDEIMEFCAPGKEELFKSKLIQKAVVRNFEIIGEAAKKIPDDFKRNFNQVPWRSMTDFRNHLIHEYFDIDLEILWDVVEFELPDLRERIADLVSEHPKH